MGRLLDELRAGRVTYYSLDDETMSDRHRAQYRELNRYTCRILTGEVPVIEASNVAEYYFVQPGTAGAEEFPCIAPIYKAFWVEYRMPTHLGMPLHYVEAYERCRIGCLCFYAEKPEGGWRSVFALFAEENVGDGKRVYGPNYLAIEHLPPDGTPDLTQMCPFPSARQCPDATDLSLLLQWAAPVFVTISWHHAKGITTVEHTVDVKLAKRHYERKGVWPVKYRTLVVEPNKDIVRRDVPPLSPGEACDRRLHLCRGHLADYRKGNGLFGRTKALVFIPAHYRGTPREGEEPPLPRNVIVRAPSKPK